MREEPRSITALAGSTTSFGRPETSSADREAPARSISSGQFSRRLHRKVLDDKLGPLLLQFPYFNKTAFKSSGEFLTRLRFFLKRLQGTTVRYAVEIRNKNWLDARFADLLREHRVALALIDQEWMPRPSELFERFDPITTDFTYVRLLGDRKGIEKITKTWDKTIFDRQADLAEWVRILRKVHQGKIRTFAYANNHYAGHGPATVEQFQKLWGPASR
jgi:uncharacterized protein YecE (DUF72 family)